MPPGVLWVSSRIHAPSTALPPSIPPLTPAAFCSWYENQHIQEVTALSGVPRAARYEALPEQPDNEAWSVKALWLTVYEMTDIEFRESKEFKGLDGQSLPKGDLLDRVFRQARFDTRFYEETGIMERGDGKSTKPASHLISYSSSSPLTSSELESLKGMTGFKRVRLYKVVNSTTLDRFERVEAEVKAHLALVEFGEGGEWESVRGFLGSGSGVEIGWYGLKRVYTE